MDSLIHISNLNTSFKTKDGNVNAVCNVNLDLKKGEIFGLVGETGCGKSVLGLSILRLLPYNAICTGEIFYEERNLLLLTLKEMQKLRGRKIALIPQNPSEALNPVLRNGNQIIESIKLNQKATNKAARNIATDILKELNFSDPEWCMRQYPHCLSGGMKQRVLAAMGMSGKPELLIADEPTKGLDAQSRGQIAGLLKKLAGITGAGILLITHDLKLASNVCQRLGVMYAGEIIEMGTAYDIFENPAHPYVKALIASQPDKGLFVLKGTSPSLINLPSNCRFYDRCEMAADKCSKVKPDMKSINETHEVRCILN